jgi:hypothetical protein
MLPWKGVTVNRLVLGAAVAASVAVLAQPARAHVFTIEADSKIGSFAVKRDGTLAGAIAAFGTPAETFRDDVVCTARWPEHGLRIVFYNLGGEDPCSPEGGFFATARASGPHWKTLRGLRIGDGQRRLRALYPNARFRSASPGFWPAGWWLIRRWSPIGSGGYYPGLLAKMRDRRVVTFHVRYPAGGD